MSLSTYDDLIAAVADWSARNSINANRAPDFIRLLEARLNRELRVPQMQSRAAASIQGGDAYLSLPQDIAQIVVLTHDDQFGGDLEFVTAHWLRNYYRNQSGRPRHYAQFGSEWQIGPKPDADYNFEAIYYAKIPALSAAQANWLFDTAPDVYLWGTLHQAAIFYKNQGDIALFGSGVNDAIASLNRAGQNLGYNGSPLIARAV